MYGMMESMTRQIAREASEATQRKADAVLKETNAEHQKALREALREARREFRRDKLMSAVKMLRLQMLPLVVKDTLNLSDAELRKAEKIAASPPSNS
jgi:hypothetical protein